MWGLASIGAEAREALPVVMAAFREDSNPPFSHYTYGAVVEIGKGDPRTIPALREMPMRVRGARRLSSWAISGPVPAVLSRC